VTAKLLLISLLQIQDRGISACAVKGVVLQRVQVPHGPHKIFFASNFQEKALGGLDRIAGCNNVALVV
jgi:hypothetical protein